MCWIMSVRVREFFLLKYNNMFGCIVMIGEIRGRVG